MDKETFICKGCGHDLPNDFSIRTEDYCYMCDPNVTVDELLKDYDDKVTEMKAARERLGADKLELKHLGPYLSFGLKIKILNHKCDYVGIEYSEANGFYFVGESLHLTYNGGSTGKDISLFKPILRPLSDYFDITSPAMKELNLSISDQIALANIASGIYHTSELPYRLICRLAEEHIDFMGLIPAGLAMSYKEAGL